MNAKSTEKLHALYNIPQILKISLSAACLLIVNVRGKRAKASVSLSLNHEKDRNLRGVSCQGTN